MNTRQMKKYIKKFGEIVYENKRPPETDPYSVYYGKKSYEARFGSDQLGISMCCGDFTRTKVYKSIVETIREEQARTKCSETTTTDYTNQTSAEANNESEESEEFLK